MQLRGFNSANLVSNNSLFGPHSASDDVGADRLAASTDESTVEKGTAILNSPEIPGVDVESETGDPELLPSSAGADFQEVPESLAKSEFQLVPDFRPVSKPQDVLESLALSDQPTLTTRLSNSRTTPQNSIRRAQKHLERYTVRTTKKRIRYR